MGEVYGGQRDERLADLAAPADLGGLSPVPADQFSMQGQPAVAVGARCSPGDRVRLYEWKAVVPELRLLGMTNNG
jgi:hypothetical protein